MASRGRQDANLNEIVKAFETFGFSVHRVGQHPAMPYDLVAGKSGKNWLIEVKDPSKPPSRQRLTSGEIKFMERWKGSYRVVKTVEDVREIANESVPVAHVGPF